MTKSWSQYLNFIIMAIVSLLLVVSPLSILSASAASPESLYTYDFSNITGISSNLAVANNGVNLTFSGSWSSDSTGTTFRGNTTSTQSVAYGKPSAGTTINVSSTNAVGAAAIIKYQGPAAGTCFADSQNISQIGSYANNQSQIKLQLSKCRSGQVYPECRIAGSLTPVGNNALRGATTLVNGNEYRIECVKSPDTGTSSTVTMRITNITTNPSAITTTVFNIPATGQISSTSFVTAGNKYPLTSQATNTDQFNGVIKKLSYCRGTTLIQAQTCLSEEVPTVIEPPVPTGPYDEIKYSYGNNPDEVVFSWRGTESTIFYGTQIELGLQKNATNSTITPVDIEGPFREVTLSGLQPNTLYYYRIGLNGEVNTFKSAPIGSFKWSDFGDSGSSDCYPWMTSMHQFISEQKSDFVTHGGDISYANYCGEQAVHQYYTDQEVWSKNTAFQPVWGNHEYGAPSATAPVGTPRDSLANYKGRGFITNAQTVPNDTTSKVSNPGCGEEIGSLVNTCLGEDWGWFKAGGVLYISYPEPWPNALTDWEVKASALMAQAQADNSIDFIITYGHRPAYSSTSEGPDLNVKAAIDNLAQQYSPRIDNPNGKYIVSVGHHAHSAEAFSPINGLTHVVSAAGGQSFNQFTNIHPNSVFRLRHLGVLNGTYDAINHSMKLEFVCGPNIPNIGESCNYGDVMYSTTFQSTVGVPNNDPAILNSSITNNTTTQNVGSQAIYDVAVSNIGDQTANNVLATINLPQNMTIVSAADATVSGQNVSWDVGNLVAGQSITKQLIVELISGQNGNLALVDLAVSSQDNSCFESTSSCTATDIDTIISLPSFIQWVNNQSIDSNIIGWTGKYGGSSLVSVAYSLEQSRSPGGSIKISGLSGASNLNSGFNDDPKLVANTVAGKTYNGSIWFKPQFVGQSIVFRLREYSPGWTIITDKKLTYTATSTNWVEVTNNITTSQNNNWISYIVYGADIDAGEYFYIDDLSLTSTP